MTISRSEREELARIARLRSKVSKASVAAREAELMAGVEEQLSAEYQFDDHAWADIARAAAAACAKADQEVAQRCRDLGIPDRYRPSLHVSWSSRGENSLSMRRAELRALAWRRVDAFGKRAKEQIEAVTAEVLTELITQGIESEEGRAFLEKIPTPEQLMPEITIGQLEADWATRPRSTSTDARHGIWSPAQPRPGTVGELEQR
jgi:hypothetical protein